MTQSIIDTTTFEELKAAMGADFIGELIDTYCEETPALIAQLEGALAEGNVDAFRRAAHSIKSSSATFGALGFSAQAKELEMIAKQGDIRGTEAKVATLVAAYPPVAQALKDVQHGS
jgi:histidine phosphotransfer protein HptB